MPGISGQFFKNFGLTVVAAVLISLAVARLITPMVAAYFLKAKGHQAHGEGSLMDRYMRVLHWTLDTEKVEAYRARRQPVPGAGWYGWSKRCFSALRRGDDGARSGRACARRFHGSEATLAKLALFVAGLVVVRLLTGPIAALSARASRVARPLPARRPRRAIAITGRGCSASACSRWRSPPAC